MYGRLLSIIFITSNFHRSPYKGKYNTTTIHDTQTQQNKQRQIYKQHVPHTQSLSVSSTQGHTFGSQHTANLLRAGPLYRYYTHQQAYLSHSVLCTITKCRKALCLIPSIIEIINHHRSFVYCVGAHFSALIDESRTTGAFGCLTLVSSCVG